jgi:hypothetical protein
LGLAFLSLSRRSFPFIERVFADSGYVGEKVAKATLIAEIVRKNPDQVGFAFERRRRATRPTAATRPHKFCRMLP